MPWKNGEDWQANDGSKHYSYEAASRHDKEDRESENRRVDKLRKERDDAGICGLDIVALLLIGVPTLCLLLIGFTKNSFRFIGFGFLGLIASGLFFYFIAKVNIKTRIILYFITIFTLIGLSFYEIRK